MLTPLAAGDPRQIGPFRIHKRIGAGGMGSVYLGFDASGRAAAVKVPAESLAGAPEFRARFRREVEAARRVNGRSVAAVLDADPDAASPWLAVEYVEGVSLADAVIQNGPLDPGLLHGFGVGLADALVAIHAAGVVHRDLKPSNILLAWDGPKVIDFGIARATGTPSHTRTGILVGTPAWMAPEQLRGERAGPPADIFAWGACVTYAATGHPPFGGADPGDVLTVLNRNDKADLEGVPAELLGTVQATLSWRPEDRPTATELVAMLVSDLRARAGGDIGRAVFLALAPWRAAPPELLGRERPQQSGPPESQSRDGRPHDGLPGQGQPAQPQQAGNGRWAGRERPGEQTDPRGRRDRRPTDQPTQPLALRPDPATGTWGDGSPADGHTTLGTLPVTRSAAAPAAGADTGQATQEVAVQGTRPAAARDDATDPSIRPRRFGARPPADVGDGPGGGVEDAERRRDEHLAETALAPAVQTGVAAPPTASEVTSPVGPPVAPAGGPAPASSRLADRAVDRAVERASDRGAGGTGAGGGRRPRPQEWVALLRHGSSRERALVTAAAVAVGLVVGAAAVFAGSGSEQGDGDPSVVPPQSTAPTPSPPPATITPDPDPVHEQPSGPAWRPGGTPSSVPPPSPRRTVPAQPSASDMPPATPSAPPSATIRPSQTADAPGSPAPDPSETANPCPPDPGALVPTGGPSPTPC